MPKVHWKREYVGGSPRVDVKGNRFYDIFDINPSKRIKDGKLKVKKFELMLDPGVDAKYLGFKYYNYDGDYGFYYDSHNSRLKLTFKRPEYGERMEVGAHVELTIEYPDGTSEEIKRSISLIVPEGSKEPGSIKNSSINYKEYEKRDLFDND